MDELVSLLAERLSEIVMILFGVTIGGVLQSGPDLAPPARRTGTSVIATARDYAEAALPKHWTRAQALTIAAFYGVAAILAALVLTSSIEMDWVVFLASIFVGFVLTQIVSSRGKPAEPPRQHV